MTHHQTEQGAGVEDAPRGECEAEREMRDSALKDAYDFIRERGQWNAFMEAIGRPRPKAK